jgi:hypothetical protein
MHAICVLRRVLFVLCEGSVLALDFQLVLAHVVHEIKLIGAKKEGHQL